MDFWDVLALLFKIWIIFYIAGPIFMGLWTRFHDKTGRKDVQSSSSSSPLPIQPESATNVLYATERARGKDTLSQFPPAPYHPHSLISPIIERTHGNYQLPGGTTDVPPPETAAIIAIILYFIQKDPSIGKTKLEQYIIMLDNICFEKTQKRLFCYRLSNGPYGYHIPNFELFLDYIEQKRFITKEKVYFDFEKYKWQFQVCEKVPDELFPEPLSDWLEYITKQWWGIAADQTKQEVRSQIKPKALKAFTSIPVLR